MLCYRCGSHVPDTSDTCPTCGQKYDAAARQATSVSARRRGGAESAPYKSGEVVAGRFAIRELVGAGPLGHVFRALDQAHDVEVALKIINPRLLQEPEERTQFSLVLKVGKKLNHSYLQRVYEEGFDQDRPYFTTQLIEGMTLRRMMEMRVAKGQPFTLREVEPLLGQLATAIDAAHRYGPHSDLKPENVIVLPDMLKVTDYGLALGIPRPPFVQAQKGYRADGYIAPEYVSGGEIDARMDIYSLAVIVGEMLTGLMPDGDGVPELLLKNPDLPPAFEAIYRRALNANPTVRPKTAGEFAAEVSAIVAKGSSAMNPVVRSPPPVSPAPRTGDKPPPPVPTDQLPIPQIAQPVAARPAPREPEPPADATQPMDAAMLAAIMAAPAKAPGAPKAEAPEPPVRPTGASKPSESRPGESRSGRSAPQKASSAASPSPAVSQPVAAPAAVTASPASRAAKSPPVRPAPAPQRSSMLLWLVLLTVAGLVTGSAVGYLLLKRLRAAPAPGAVTPSPGGATPQPTDGSPGAPMGAMAPAGRCPAGMKLVSGGAFKMGTAADDPDKASDERLLGSLQVPSFCIDEFEYPNKAGVRPTVNVSWLEAKDACQKDGKRLCTEEEWEKACKGAGNARFPYGNDFDANACNTDDAEGQDRMLAESGRFASCRSTYGVSDLSGNVSEWTATPYAGGADMTRKGGAYDRSSHGVRCAARINGVPSERLPTVGFRCCAGVEP